MTKPKKDATPRANKTNQSVMTRRHESIRAMRASGVTMNEIASAHFINERTVRRILKQAEATERG